MMFADDPMAVPFADLGRENRALEPQLMEAMQRVLRSGRYLYGPELEAFETELAASFGVQHAVGVAHGTDAVEIALRCANKTRVTLPAFTAVPCANAAEAAGCEIELVDVRLKDGNAPFTDLAVSMFGTAVDSVAEEAVEDIAHAMGAWGHGKLAGTRGLAGAVSFYPTKILGALGDGGAIVTDNADLAARARQMRHYGFDIAGNVCHRGQNSRLNELQAAILRVKLPHVTDWIARRQEIAKRYDEELKGRVVPVAGPGSVYHVYVVRHPERDRIRAVLAEKGIGTMIHYDRAIHQHDRWKHLGWEGRFPNAELLAREVFSLPCYPYLTDEEQDAVIAAVKEAT